MKYCCDKFHTIEYEQLVVKGHDGPNRVELHTLISSTQKELFYTCYINFCPFCGAKL